MARKSIQRLQVPLGSQGVPALWLGPVLLVLFGLLAVPLNPHQAAAQTKKTDPPKTDQKLDLKTPIENKGKPDVIVGGHVDEIALINAEIQKKYQENKLQPARRATDFEFIRRASLDIIGRIAKPTEIREFLGWPAEQRRSQLIDKLLKGDEWAHNFANIFANLLMTRASSKLHHEQMKTWLVEEFTKEKADWSKTTTSLLSATGKTNGDDDAPAVNFILTHLGERAPGNPAINGEWDVVPVTSRITRLFLGLRTQCTQCHDHPFNDEWKQENFWGINAYLRQVTTPNGRPGIGMNKKMPAEQQFMLKDNLEYNKDGMVRYERRSGLVEVTKAFFLDGTKLPAKIEGTRRQELARRVVASPYFAKAFVNRMWGHFFGRGFTKDVDDFGDHSPVSHPELLDKLARDWATTHHHDPRVLIRWICNSQAYGLSSQANPTNDKPDAEPFFSRMLLKALTPEQLFESLMTATGATDGLDRAAIEKKREAWMNKLVVNFGDDEGNEGNFNGTVVQALLMMNGQELNEAVMNPKGTLSVLLNRIGGVKGVMIPRAAQEAVVKEMYLIALNRQPKVEPAKKIDELKRVLDPERMKLGGPAILDITFFRGYSQDLFWAMLNSNEFMLNH